MVKVSCYIDLSSVEKDVCIQIPFLNWDKKSINKFLNNFQMTGAEKFHYRLINIGGINTLKIHIHGIKGDVEICSSLYKEFNLFKPVLKIFSGAGTCQFFESYIYSSSRMKIYMQFKITDGMKEYSYYIEKDLISGFNKVDVEYCPYYSNLLRRFVKSGLIKEKIGKVFSKKEEGGKER